MFIFFSKFEAKCTGRNSVHFNFDAFEVFSWNWELLLYILTSSSGSDYWLFWKFVFFLSHQRGINPGQQMTEQLLLPIEKCTKTLLSEKVTSKRNLLKTFHCGSQHTTLEASSGRNHIGYLVFFRHNNK